MPIRQQVVEDRIEVLIGWLTRLHQSHIDANFFKGADTPLRVVIRREKDALCGRKQVGRLFEEFSAGHLQHLLVHKKECNRLVVAFQLLQFLKRFARGSLTNDAIPVPVPLLEVLHDQLERLLVIVHDQQYRFGHNALPAKFNFSRSIRNKGLPSLRVRKCFQKLFLQAM